MIHLMCFVLQFFFKDITFCDQFSWNLVWSDEFDETSLNTKFWDYDYGNGCQYGICGWGNAELQYYTNSTSNSYIQNGSLVIDAIKEKLDDSEYTSARLITRGKIQWRFGKIEVRVKIPDGKGLWPAVWMLPSDKIYGDWPRSGEIDILEVLGRDPSVAHCTAHFGNAWYDKSQKSDVLKLAGEKSFADDFHVFKIVWGVDRIAWFIDGKRILVVTRADVGDYVYPFNEDFYLVINLAVGGNWPQSPDNSTKFPASMLVDYVRVYQNWNNFFG